MSFAANAAKQNKPISKARWRNIYRKADQLAKDDAAGSAIIIAAEVSGFGEVTHALMANH